MWSRLSRACLIGGKTIYVEQIVTLQLVLETVETEIRELVSHLTLEIEEQEPHPNHNLLSERLETEENRQALILKVRNPLRNVLEYIRTH